jgi:Zn-dependent protease
MRREADSEYTIIEPAYSYSYSLGPYGVVSRRKTGFFGRTELKHIAIAVVVLVGALTMVLWDRSADTIAVTLGGAALAVVLGFFLHEMAHKYVAKRYGCWAEFRAYYNGLLFAVMLSFLGVLFAAPGAVYISGNVSREQNGRISLAGPAVNMMVALVALPMFLWEPMPEAVTEVTGIVLYLNAFLAAFNLIPVRPLDGSKVWAWSRPVYLASVAAAGSLLALALILLFF